MVSSFLVSIVFLILQKNGVQVSTHVALILTVLTTSVCWIVTAYVGPETDKAVLVDFYRKVRPSGPGWEPVRVAAGVSDRDMAATGDNIPMALLGWVAGCTAIWSALFTVGNVLYGRWGYASVLFVVFLVSGLALQRVTRTLWAASSAS